MKTSKPLQIQPLLLTAATLVLGGLGSAPARASDASDLISLDAKIPAVSFTHIAQAQTTQATPLKDGIYFYGEAATADQSGRGYVVFTQRQGKVVGALYHPRSDYACFSGTIQSRQLNITSFGMENERIQLQVALEPLYQISGLSEVGQRTLAACQQEIASLEATQQPYAQRPKAAAPTP
jgi:hypothetical protein